MNVAEATGLTLVALGVRDVFGLIGSGNFILTNALVRSGVRVTPARHECAATSMADAYARVSGRVGVVTVHQGPGLTNSLTALTEAAKAHSPLVVLAADTSAGAVASNFRIDQAGLAESLGAAFRRVHDADSACEEIVGAWRLASEERRAVLVSLPLDVQGADAPAREVSVPVASDPVGPSPHETAEVGDALEAARAPLVIAGRGAVLAGAGRSIDVLADRIGALLATSANGHGLFSQSPWWAGISGGFASPTEAKFLSEADLVIGIGASLNMWTTRHGALIGKRARVVQIDVDGDVIGNHQKVDLGIVGDAGVTARSLTEELDRRGHRSEGYRRSEIRAALEKGRWRHVSYQDRSDEQSIDPRTLTLELDAMLPPERTVAVDSGHFMGWPPMYLSVPDAAGFVFTQSFQSIGLGLSSAIGASVARPDRLTVACLGDGGALMAAGEFETLVRLRLPLLVIVYNDAAYGAEVHHFGPQGHPVDIARYPDPDIAGLARGLGAEASTVRGVGDLATVRRWLEQRDGPFVIDAKVSPSVVAEWLEEAFRSH
jgi:thiamine pyrophosphate-dependent acetolactate synthase large subunit-like protein